MRRIAFALVMTSSAVVALAGSNWPQFRGPTGDGKTDAANLPLTWSETSNVKWKTAIHGRGWSSPVIWDKQIWMTTATKTGEKMYAICVDRDSGKIVHDIKLLDVAKPGELNAFNSYASPTPVIEAGRVYIHFGSYGTMCLDTATGKTIWSRRDLPCDHGVGPGSSPIPDGPRLILTFDGMDVQYVAALDKLTGKTVWKTKRSIDFGTASGEIRKAFSTPTLIAFGGRRQLVSSGAWAAMAYDPETGKELWKVRYGSRGRGFSTVARTMFACGLAFVNSGFPRPELVAVRPDARGDVTATHVAWRLNKDVPNKTSPAIVDGLMYLIHDYGTLTCLDAKTGKTVYLHRAKAKHSASPIVAPGRIYLFDDKSTTTVIRPGREYKELAVNKLDSGCMGSAAISDKAMFLRTKTHLYRIEE